VLQILDNYNAKATFFCIGRKAMSYPDICREIVKRGHAVENHSQLHWHNFSLLGTRKLIREINTAQTTLTDITGQAPQFFRAPAGLRNLFLDHALTRLGLQLATWSVRGFDTQVNNADKVKIKLLDGLRAGAILLLHDGNAARTADGKPVITEVLPEILESARISGLRFVTLRDARLS
jgi:peptidoglycan/xylan/chitin deacetylase (PgdA/CDA1 family)